MADLTHQDWLAAAGRLTPETRPFIGGRHVESTSDTTFPSVSPRDGREIARIPAGSEQDVDRAVHAARESFEDGRWRDLPPRERKRILLRWAELVTEHARELALLDTLEMGKPISESQRVDVAKTAETIAWYAETIDKTYDEVAPTPGAALALDHPRTARRRRRGRAVELRPADRVVEARPGPGHRQLRRAQARRADVAGHAAAGAAGDRSRAAGRRAQRGARARRGRRAGARAATRTWTRSPSPAPPRSRGCSRSTPGSPTASRSPWRRAASRRS